MWTKTTDSGANGRVARIQAPQLWRSRPRARREPNSPEILTSKATFILGSARRSLRADRGLSGRMQSAAVRRPRFSRPEALETRRHAEIRYKGVGALFQ